jgi:hypothetical protein
MKKLEHITDIPAPAEEVWAVLTDTGSYAEWNPFIRKLEGPWAPGARLAVAIKAGAREMGFRPTVLAYEEGRLIRWRGRLLLPGIVDGEHELRVEPLSDSTSRFTQRETFRGLLVPFLRGTLEDTDRGFADMNEALRERVLARLSR